jgi:hypothetical protein
VILAASFSGRCVLLQALGRSSRIESKFAIGDPNADS